MTINCKYWTAFETHPRRGVCDLGLFKGLPSELHCKSICKECKNLRVESPYVYFDVEDISRYDGFFVADKIKICPISVEGTVLKLDANSNCWQYIVRHVKEIDFQILEDKEISEQFTNIKEEDKKRSLKNMTAEFIDANARTFKEGRVKREVRDHRLSICTGITVEGKKISGPCDYYKDEDKGWGSGHCKTCGCPDWPVSEMRRKAYYSLGCPKGKFSEMPGRRAKCDCGKDSSACSSGS